MLGTASDGCGRVRTPGPLALRRFRKARVAWQGRCIFRGRGSIFARSSADFVAGAAFLRCQVQISWQRQHFRKFPALAVENRNFEAQVRKVQARLENRDFVVHV